MNEVPITVNDVEVRRAGKVILSVARLVVQRGAFVGVVGPNGAGKTTLLNVCAGLAPISRGRVRVLGEDVGTLSGWGGNHLRRRIGYVPQRADYFPDLPLTTREVVTLGRVGPRGLLRRIRREDRRLVERWIEGLGLAELAGRTFRSLSGGEQQKALIARAMVQEPGLLLLDEPAGGLDLDWKERLVSLLDELFRKTGLTVMMVSHETGLLPASTTHVVLLRSGQVLASGAPGEVLTNPVLSEAYGCDVEVARRDGRYHALARGARQR